MILMVSTYHFTQARQLNYQFKVQNSKFCDLFIRNCAKISEVGASKGTTILLTFENLTSKCVINITVWSIPSLKRFSTSLHRSSTNGSKDGLARGKVLRKPRKTKNVDDWSAYKILRNNCSNVKRKAKANYITKIKFKKGDKIQNNFGKQ